MDKKHGSQWLLKESDHCLTQMSQHNLLYQLLLYDPLYERSCIKRKETGDAQSVNFEIQNNEK